MAQADLVASINRSGELRVESTAGGQALAVGVSEVVYAPTLEDRGGRTHSEVVCVGLRLVNVGQREVALRLGAAGWITLQDGSEVRSTIIAARDALNEVRLHPGEEARGRVFFESVPWDKLDVPMEPSPVRLNLHLMLADGLGVGTWLLDAAGGSDQAGGRQVAAMLVGAEVHYLLL
jgi:hypothetical protein